MAGQIDVFSVTLMLAMVSFSGVATDAEENSALFVGTRSTTSKILGLKISRTRGSGQLSPRHHIKGAIMVGGDPSTEDDGRIHIGVNP